MKHGGKSTTGERRTQVPSHEPMLGVEDDSIDVGAATGAQLPPRLDRARSEKSSGSSKSNLNTNQADLLTEFWPQKSVRKGRR